MHLSDSENKLVNRKIMAFKVQKTATKTAASSTPSASVNSPANDAGALDAATADKSDTIATAAASEAAAKTAAKKHTGAGTKVDLTANVTALKSTLALSDLTEPKDILLGNLGAFDEELADGVEAIALALGFAPTPESVAFKFIPRQVDDKGSVRDAFLLGFSIVAGDGTCDMRWVNERLAMDSDGSPYATGMRGFTSKSGTLSTAGYIIQHSVMLRNDLKKEETARLQVAETFAELAQYLSAGAGSINADPEDGFLLLVDKAETRKSSKGKDYTLVLGTEINPETSAQGQDCAVFSPAPADYWVAYSGGKAVCQFDKTGKQWLVLSATEADAEGNALVLDALPLSVSAKKLKELELETTWGMVGTRRTKSEQWGDGWVLRLVSLGNGESVDVFANSKIEHFIDDNEAAILKASGVEPTKENEYPILDLTVEEPFGEIEILSHEKLPNGAVKVNCIIKLYQQAEQLDEQKAKLAALGLL